MTKLVFKKENKWIYLIIMLSAMSIFSQLNFVFDILITLAFFAVAIILINKDEFVLIYAVLYVFMGRLMVYQGGVSLVNVFLLLYVARMIFKGERLKLNRYLLPILIMLFLHGFFVLFPAFNYNIIKLINYLASILLIFSLLNKLKDIELLRKFLITLSVSSIAACIYGIVNKNSYSFSETLNTGMLVSERFKGVSSDPNYMAITFLIGLLGIFALKNQNKLLSIALGFLLIYFILTTESTTALLCLILILVIYLIMQRKPTNVMIVSFISAIGIMMIIANFNEIYGYLLQSQNYASFASRVTGQINDIFQHNNNDIASGRLVISVAYWKYFWEQNIFRILFGGNMCGIYGMGKYVLTFLPGLYATHNTQLDILMSTGLIGWLIFSFLAIRSMINTWKMYFANNEGIYKLLFMIKSVIMLFSFSLAFFPSWTILVFYLLDLKTNKSLGCDQY